MKFFDPHIHMSSRTTDDYQAMAAAGIRAVIEPAFWFGQPRTNIGSFIDYYASLIGWERFRASQFGIAHYCAMGLNSKEANNEGLAREVLELHTLGVGGGYAQADVTELARALTGWTVPGIGRVGRFAQNQPSGAAFVALVHEPGVRSVLGRSYPAGEAGQALAILDDLAAHPATARHIATKFARHFAGDTPPPALVARLEADFLRSGGDLASLTRVVIEAPEAWAPGPVILRAPRRGSGVWSPA